MNRRTEKVLRARIECYLCDKWTSVTEKKLMNHCSITLTARLTGNHENDELIIAISRPLHIVNHHRSAPCSSFGINPMNVCWKNWHTSHAISPLVASVYPQALRRSFFVVYIEPLDSTEFFWTVRSVDPVEHWPGIVFNRKGLESQL